MNGKLDTGQEIAELRGGIEALDREIAVWGGVLGALLLLLKKRLAVPMLLVSFLSMIVTSIHNFLLSDGMEVMGTGGVAFSGLIFVVALCLWLDARAMAKRKVLT